ncbi:MAG: hypothetical protein BWX74_00778 [Tenericutes bacterium ADurb.Bin087]|nr:MAG: hypothetical protein BWX74_00778 [Tenericutes bacterium ADurb.Bin087]
MRRKFMVLIAALLVISGCKGGSSTINSEDLVIYPTEITNGSFEDGIQGWEIGGLGGFNEEDITNLDVLPDGQASLKVGNYFYAGGTSSLPSFTGTLTSAKFKLDGLGLISVKLGAAKDPTKSYIEFFKVGKEEPLEFTLNSGTEKVTKLTNTDFNGTTITSQLIRNVVDLSEYLLEPIYIKVTDNDTKSDYTDYSFWNLDDFKLLNTAQEKNDALVERADQLLQFAEEDIDQDPPVEVLRNGGFETGDASYWKVLSGRAFSGSIISSTSEFYWGNRLYHGEGSYLLNNFADETLVGKMRSEKFSVVDKGDNKSFVSFKLGGAAHTDVYITLNKGLTGEVIGTYRNIGFRDPGLALSLVTYYVDVSAHIGEVLYFTLVDNAAGGPFGALVADDFKVNLSETEVKTGIGNLRTWAANLDDEAAKPDYIDVYNGGISFPISGSAPVISLTEGGFAYEATLGVMTTSLNRFLKNITVKDDYTATTELVRSITSVKYNGTPVSNPDLENFELQKGTYLLAISVKDAYANEATAEIKLTVEDAVSYNNIITNGNFETGDLSGWTVVDGNVNVDNAISDATTYWMEEIPFNKEGTYFFNGWDACGSEVAGYALRSSTFTLSGSGQISFKMGGRSSRLKVYDESGVQIASYHNHKFNSDGAVFPLIKNGSRLATMTTYVADLSAYLGANLYIEIVDEVISQDWAVAFFDDIKTYYETTLDFSGLSDVVIQNGEEVHIPYEAVLNN